MKKITTILLLLFISCFEGAFAQISDKDWKYIMVREDIVKPSMTKYYEATLSDLKQFLTENNVKHVSYMTQLQDNFNYSHVTPLKNMNDMDGGLESFIKGKERSAEFDLIWSDLNETIESYSYYVVKYESEMSYVPDGKVWLEDAPYRRWNYLYFEPGTEKEADQILLAYKNLYQTKGVKSGFRVFKGVIGLDQPVIMFTTWSKTPLDYQKELQESIALLGEEGAVLWVAMMELVSNAQTLEGWYLPQYSYNPETQKK
ncbi:hypothetical protein QRD02_04090 [Aequorivita sp. SDUM287046]|uniref:GLPGLI family protein n=1 Tax=Aequorivita aurantiaca TaxID=3053356 RepID=A0ABT8DI30_9FLAO|nr:hypothetical protein [Aequorivita aurantiaca]MDN3723550.1 hypothetical protein [Aequorivita aurantiaca]